MNKKLFFLLFLSILFIQLNGQEFQPLIVQGGFNADVIANGVGDPSNSVNASVDKSGYVLLSSDFKLEEDDSPLGFGLPLTRVINSVAQSTRGVVFKLAPYNENNVLRLEYDVEMSGELFFSNPIAGKSLHMLAASGDGASPLAMAVYFTDGSLQFVENVEVDDWFSGGNYAIKGIGRYSIDDLVMQADNDEPRLYQYDIAIDQENQDKLISSIRIQYNGNDNDGVANIFAFSVRKDNTCKTPENITYSADMSSATVSWIEANDPPENGYEYYYSKSSDFPSEDTVPMGIIASGTTTKTFSLEEDNLEFGETYYFWLRSNCGEGKGFWRRGTFRVGVLSTTYVNGDINTEFIEEAPSNLYTSACPGVLSVEVPEGYRIASTKVSYSVTTSNGIPLNYQATKLKNVTNGFSENEYTFGEGENEGTEFYSREGLDLANGLTGTVVFELLAFRGGGQESSGENCGTTYAKIDNNTWTISVQLEIDPDYNPCKAPTNIKSINSFTSSTISWDEPSSIPSEGYEYYYSLSSEEPDYDVVPKGVLASGTRAISFTLDDGFREGQQNYFWIRSNCGEGKGFWKRTIFTLGEVSVLYTDGDIPTEYIDSEEELDPTFTSSCPGVMSITVPEGYRVKSTNLSYSMTAYDDAYISEQRSLLRNLTNNQSEEIISSTGSGENEEYDGEGTYMYKRSVDIANGLSGTIEFQLNAWKTWMGDGEYGVCGVDYNKVDNNTWKISLVLEEDPDYGICKSPVGLTATNGLVSSEITWEDPVVTPSGGYEYYYSTSAIAPAESVTPKGTLPSDTTSKTVSLTDGLELGKSYYFWLRSNCGEEKGIWRGVNFIIGELVVVYTNGDIGTEYIVDDYYGETITNASESACPGVMSIEIPDGYKIKSAQVSYSMTAYDNAYISEQRSLVRCLSNNRAEDEVSYMPEASPYDAEGTHIYNRDLDIANGLTGTVEFQLNAWKTWAGESSEVSCGIEYNKVDNNTWEISILLEPIDALSIPDFGSKKPNMVYPNPFKDVLRISKSESVEKVIIADFAGRVVKTIAKPTSELHLENLNSGVYVLTLIQKDGTTQSVKVIKE